LSSQEPTLVGTQQLAFPESGLSFSYPTTWTPYAVPGDITVLSNQGSRPAHLASGGVTVTWRALGYPLVGLDAATTIGGRPARIVSGQADRACAAVGGTRTVDATIAGKPNSLTGNVIEMTACIAGPDEKQTEADVMTMLDSAQFAS
jgi:hypothetical protein